MEKRIKILIVKPQKKPYIEVIDNTLEAFQSAVGGYIEVVPIDENILLVCNEEGRIEGLPFNREVGGCKIVGTFIITSSNAEGDFISLSEEQISKVQNYL